MSQDQKLTPAAPAPALERAGAFVRKHRKPLGALAVAGVFFGLRAYVGHVRRHEYRHGYRDGWADREYVGGAVESEPEQQENDHG